MGDEQRCPNKQISVEILQSIYMLIANVLLLNLLIALFSSTYGKPVIQIFRFRFNFEFRPLATLFVCLLIPSDRGIFEPYLT